MTGFLERHIGVSDADIQHMLEVIGVESLDELIEKTVPSTIRMKGALNIPAPKTEVEALATLQGMANQNQVWRSFLGMGYYRTYTPAVILRNLIENPSWYTSYTPYQAEISQGRLEALLIFQTMVQDLTAMPLANSSLLDEATAAAEAMAMVLRAKTPKRQKEGTPSKIFFISELCNPNTIAVVQSRAEPLDVEVVIGDHQSFTVTEDCIGVLLQYPATNGQIFDYSEMIANVKAVGGYTVMATDLMALTLLKAPGEMGADIVVGNSQRFGVPMGFGGPHAAFLACTEEHKKNLPGRIIGVSVDADGHKALRMALQTREQHIRREKATSNVCTAQALLANVAAMFAVYHGPKRIQAMAEKMHHQACAFAKGLQSTGFETTTVFFDTVSVECGENVDLYQNAAKEKQINLRQEGSKLIVAFDECITEADIADLQSIFAIDFEAAASVIPSSLQRESAFLTDSCFNSYHSETDMLRYLHKLAKRDLALDTAMIPLGSCTMKLNATTEMIPITWPAFNALHPHIPDDQAQGYHQLFAELENWLAEITGFDAVSLQPNAGSQGEYAGLLAIRGYHLSRGDLNRNICLIPTSAHGTNPASAVMAGMEVVKVKCDAQGNIDVEDLRVQAIAHSDNLAALMVTYPSTHGVFEESIMDICNIIHEHGGQVYMDGANMNAMVGIARPGDIGADVCHLNLHKTFCIPHGGGGPGVGPIGVKSQLQPFLPKDPKKGEQAVSGALFGSASILPIPWAYIAMTGPEGLTKCSQVAILSANYIAKRLESAFPVLYRGSNGFCAHECILDTRIFKSVGVEVADIAKRLMDYGFHAPTMSWPVTGTLMVEPTESEPLKELDRFIEAMLMIREEIQQVMDGNWSVEESPLRQAPHTQNTLMQMEWKFPYSREVAAFPTAHTKDNKYWPMVRRVNDVFGDRRLLCSCAAWLDDEA